MKKILLFFMLLVSLISCKQNTDSATQEIHISTATPTRVVILPSTTATFTPEPVKTVIVDKKEFTLELIKTNNNCQLPCWWGISSGHVFEPENLNFLRSFSIVTIRRSPTWVVYYVRAPIDKAYSFDGELQFLIATQNDIVKEIQVDAFNEKTYYLNNILHSIGKPESILVSSYSSDAGAGKDIVPLTVALYYPKLGVLALYGSWANTSEGTITACFETGPKLFLWSPDSSGKYSLEYFLNWKKEYVPYFSIEESTSLTIDTFYEKYSNTKGELCLQTPIDLWPSQ